MSTQNLASSGVASTDLSESEQETVFLHFFRRLAAYRNTIELYALTEAALLQPSGRFNDSRTLEFSQALNTWGQSILKNAWVVCQEPGGGECPTLDPLADTSVGELPKAPDPRVLSKIMNTVLFLHITTSKQYSAYTRAFLPTLAPIDEQTVTTTFKNPERALREVHKQAQRVREQHAERGRVLRIAGLGFGAVAGGVLIGITGGLAAPLVGAGVTALLGGLGIGGTAAGVLASGLASSSAVCGALFGAYGARSTARMVGRHTKEVSDLAVLPVRTQMSEETLAVRLCISGWISSLEDVTTPWQIFGGDDTFALQWEVEALQAMSSALSDLIESQAINYVGGQILKRTILASLLSALSPVALLKIGKIIDNPWMNARALALKTGAVLGELLASRAFGNRPVTLTGYSLGSLVIFEALRCLTELSPSKTIGLIQDVFLFGTPVSINLTTWSSVRRLVSGRFVNGYCTSDFILAVLSRASDATWGIAGLQNVDVKGVENIQCEGVEGHLQWRGMIGKCLLDCHAPGIVTSEVDAQLKNIAEHMPELAESDDL
ncbi:DUF726-domain-containing protein [Suillus paluster]|uniref:DUF726-domain-containing protein n=1 Tax=Suillus paluster TaxID=48578 RepID=UPI001B87B220|nr:DUF726-domain-containing protein [Suillus paluster]KAG1756608.1 DUF726-domain-containing protein [Suillus paluster]